MFRIRKSYRFEAAHQLDKSFSRCCSDSIHGHSYTAEVFLVRDDLDDTGMVVDFGALAEAKTLFGSLDHALLMPSTLDPHYLSVLGKFSKKLIIVPFNPTAENIAAWALSKLTSSTIGKYVEKVRIHETSTGWAECSR